MNQSVENTLGNKDWLNQNEEALRALFPETWTNIQNINNMQIAYMLKVMGVDWRGDQLADLMTFFLKTGVCIQQEHQVKRGVNPIEFETVYRTPAQKQAKKEKKKEEVPNPMGPPVMLALLFAWIAGFVLAKGFWSTLLCIFPFWAWYLVVEKILTIWGWIPS